MSAVTLADVACSSYSQSNSLITYRKALCFFVLFFCQRQNPGFVWRKERMNMKTFRRCRLRAFRIHNRRKARQGRVCQSDRRLDAIREEFLIGDRIDIFHIFSGKQLMLFQVIIRSVRDPPQFPHTERELIFDVGRRIGIVRQLFGCMIAQTDVFFFDTDGIKEFRAVTSPVLEHCISSSVCRKTPVPSVQTHGTEYKIPGVISFRTISRSVRCRKADVFSSYAEHF